MVYYYHSKSNAYAVTAIKCVSCYKNFKVYTHIGSLEFALKNSLKMNDARWCPYCDEIFKYSVIREICEEYDILQ